MGGFILLLGNPRGWDFRFCARLCFGRRFGGAGKGAWEWNCGSANFFRFVELSVPAAEIFGRHAWRASNLITVAAGSKPSDLEIMRVMKATG